MAIGDQFLTAESGYQRYDDKDNNFTYEGNWSAISDGNWYNGTLHSANNNSPILKVKFNFIGTKLRIIQTSSSTNTNATWQVNIDGNIETYTSLLKSLTLCVLQYEKTNLLNKEHCVELSVTNLGQGYAQFDAIDIDASGILKPYKNLIKFLIKQGTQYYSIKPEFYDDITTHNFTSITLTGSNGQPNDSDCTTNGFDDIGVLTNTMTKNSDIFKPIDKLGDTKVIGVTFTTTDNLTYTVNPTTNIPFKQGSVIAYENGTIVTPSNVDLINGKVIFSTARTGTMTFDYTWINKFDIKLYKSN